MEGEVEIANWLVGFRGLHRVIEVQYEGHIGLYTPVSTKYGCLLKEVVGVV